ncbi:MAG: redox-regulated ATPase YchF [Candidatus Zambryskibacteria bacterium CG10_big_fil_rev_8_21_14_0_10_42_12]|uniref:Ribosome-binding ATPase YchF n=1 Tax=Candidatus Zambryskibacteria bacterium CG10_big_fil_rev_8_21_14_0_10_42_12 TaxID=1975115 RepID=A0A2H0QVR4_9BACT|nr:MAG: redox-regulated ATPase YchF [Candidatus Zambryskibacteria bacterium CG10_big_fil_rev_8_21_14_0_10_42_12]
MNLKIGIVGLPNVGKSTLFNALTKKAVPAENYPFCTIDPSVGIVPVPDERLDKLSIFSQSVKKIPAVVEFVDIAGLVKGAAEGEGLGNKFLSHIREVDAIAQVVRIFEDDKIIHVHGAIDPLSDIETINAELILADLETVTKRLGNLVRDVKKGDKEAMKEHELLERVKSVLESGELALVTTMSEDESLLLKSIHLLTHKPMMFVFNKKGGGKNLDELRDKRWEDLNNYVKERTAVSVVVDAGIEHELKDFEGEEKETFRKELGGEHDGVNDLIKAGYELLGLETYFTTGEDETRAWTIAKGSTAPEAGTAIHTDFKDKFIRAEIIKSNDLLEVGSYAKAREKGLLRTEGKEYIVQDGDVIEFKI